MHTSPATFAVFYIWDLFDRDEAITVEVAGPFTDESQASRIAMILSGQVVKIQP